MVFENATRLFDNVSTDAIHCVGHAQRKLAIIEIYVILTALLIGILVVFGSCRRRTHTKALKYLVWTAYVLSTSLISYTMGQMQSAPFHNELFAVWAVFLVIFLGNANSISAYDLEDNENRKIYKFVVAIQWFWMVFMLVTYFHETKFKVPLYLLYILSLLRTGERLQALTLASRSYGLVRSSKLVADFMSYEHTLSKERIDPTSMEGYNYLVNGEEEGNVRVAPPLYQLQLEITDEVITIQKIWQCQGQLLSSTGGDRDGRLKDICLSFALCKLLLRRFAGYSLSESSQPKTWKLVRYGLLSNEGDQERAFRVIEVELGFLYDFFYTKYPVIFADQGIPMLLLLKSIELIYVVGSCWIVVATLSHYHTPHRYFNLVTVSGHNVDALVTGIVIIAILFMEVVQYFVVIFSNWAKVKCLCSYVKRPTWQTKRWVEEIIQIVCHKKWLKPWERKLGQYSLLESFNHNPSKLLYNCLTAMFIDKPLKGQKESSRIKLPVEVRRTILLSLRTNGKRLSNGEASLKRNGVLNEFSWACRLETQTHVIMVWHIATSLCEIAARNQANIQIRESENFIVATSLSKYCAYLVAFAPRLLPDHAYTAETIFEQVVDEARDLLRGFKTLTTRYGKMMTLGEGDPGVVIGVGEDDPGVVMGEGDPEVVIGVGEGDPGVVMGAGDPGVVIGVGEDDPGVVMGEGDPEVVIGEGDPGVVMGEGNPEVVIGVGEDDPGVVMGEGDPGVGKIMERSVVLAKRLIREEVNYELRWKILADFWAEMMLFVAPSDDVTAHAEHLATGGEFVTHLWALLSHAGILERPSSPCLADD